LDRASEEDSLKLKALVQKHGIRYPIIQWNDGPSFSALYDRLNEAGFSVQEPGKGKNMFLGFGIAIALGAESVALLDADIRIFNHVQLERLLYPVIVLNYDLAKAYYARVRDRAFYGRVKWTLW
jgi:glucosyl-3-phosphoglycerate synthase